MAHEGGGAVMTKRAGSNAWLLSGWEIRSLGQSDAGNVATTATASKPSSCEKSRSNTWLLTGWKLKPGATNAANDATGTTHRMADSSDHTAGAGSKIVAQNPPDNNPGIRCSHTGKDNGSPRHVPQCAGLGGF